MEVVIGSVVTGVVTLILTLVGARVLPKKDEGSYAKDLVEATAMSNDELRDTILEMKERMDELRAENRDLRERVEKLEAHVVEVEDQRHQYMAWAGALAEQVVGLGEVPVKMEGHDE